MTRFIIQKMITNTIIFSVLAFLWVKLMSYPYIMLGHAYTAFAFIFLLFAWCWYLKMDSFGYFQEGKSMGYFFRNKIITPSKTREFFKKFKIDDSSYVADQSILELTEDQYDKMSLTSNLCTFVLFIVIGQIIFMVM